MKHRFFLGRFFGYHQKYHYAFRLAFAASETRCAAARLKKLTV